jgi:hypothetical protein
MRLPELLRTYATLLQLIQDQLLREHLATVGQIDDPTPQLWVLDPLRFSQAGPSLEKEFFVVVHSRTDPRLLLFANFLLRRTSAGTAPFPDKPTTLPELGCHQMRRSEEFLGL